MLARHHLSGIDVSTFQKETSVYLRNQSVKVGIGRTLYVKRAPANIIYSLIIEQHSNISVLQKGVG